MSKKELKQVILAIEYTAEKLRDDNLTEIDIKLLESVREKLIKKLNEELETE